MCFSARMSLAMAVGGLLLAVWQWGATRSKGMVAATIYFVLMELLQVTQAWILADDLHDKRCRSWDNQLQTVLGYLHITFQPYFTNLFFEATFKLRAESRPAADNPFAWLVARRLCLLQAAVYIVRLALSPGWNSDDLDTHTRRKLEDSTEWIVGPQLCSYRGATHLAWSVPLHEASYFLPGIGIHFFMMYAPLLAIDPWAWADVGVAAILSGPALSVLFSDNLHEQASIWCFFSVCQVRSRDLRACRQADGHAHGRRP